MEFIPTVAAAALIVKVVAVVKAASAREWAKVNTQVITWVVAILTVALFEAAGFALVAGITGGAPGLAGTILAGLAFGSAGSLFLYDFRAAIDNHQSSAEPKLGGAPDVGRRG